MGGLNVTDARLVKKYMNAFSYQFHPRYNPLYTISEGEWEALKRMAQEMGGNPLLAAMTKKWTKSFSKSPTEVLSATKILVRDATHFVRKPKLYKVEHALAQEAFDQGGYVEAGKIKFEQTDTVINAKENRNKNDQKKAKRIQATFEFEEVALVDGSCDESLEEWEDDMDDDYEEERPPRKRARLAKKKLGQRGRTFKVLKKRN